MPCKMAALVNPANKASGVALVYDGLVLLGKRAASVNGITPGFPLYWSIFGGALEAHETLPECAARELYEETKIRINPSALTLLGSVHNLKTELSIYRGLSQGLITPTLNNEHTEYGWFKIDFLHAFTEKIDEKIVDLLVNAPAYSPR